MLCDIGKYFPSVFLVTCVVIHVSVAEVVDQVDNVGVDHGWRREDLDKCRDVECQKNLCGHLRYDRWDTVLMTAWTLHTASIL